MARSAAGSVPTALPEPQSATAHLKDLRSTLQRLKDTGDLIETDCEVNPDLELTGLQKLMDGSCPVLFNKVWSKPNHRLLTNLFGNIEVMNRMFGWESDKDRTIKLSQALNKPLRPREVPQSEAPCHEVVIEKPDNVIDYLVPIRHTELE